MSEEVILNELKGTDKLSEAYPKINSNEAGLKQRVEGHIASTGAHKAEHVTYLGDLDSTNVKGALDETKGRIDSIVASAGDSNTEIVDARGGYTVLRDRLDDTDGQLVETTNEISTLKTNFNNYVPSFLRKKPFTKKSKTDEFLNGLTDWDYTTGIGLDASSELTMLADSGLANQTNVALYDLDDTKSIEITIGATGTPGFARIAFGTDTKNFCYIARTNTGLTLYRVINGVFDSSVTGHVLETISLTTPTYQAGDRIKGVIFGQSIQYFHNDVLLATFNVNLSKGLAVPVNKGLKAGVQWIGYAYHYSVSKVTAKSETGKFIHFSMDDVLTIMQELTDNSATYASAFDHPTFKFLKDMHVKYGLTYTLNLFYTYNGWDLSQMTTKYKNEFAVNSDWLKFAFHGYDENSKYDGSSYTSTDAGNHYTLITDQIRRFSSHDNVDPVIRSGYFTGTVETIRVWKSLGVKGVLSARLDDDAPYNYYLNTTQRETLRYCDYFYDEVEDFMFVKTDGVFDYDADPASILESRKNDIAFSGQMDMLEIFTHSTLKTDTTRQNDLENMCIWAINNGYEFDFAMNRI